MHPVRLFCFISMAFCLLSCKEVLYSELKETDANEMVAVLAVVDIEATRSRDKNGVYSVLVEGDEVAMATVALREVGLPREKFQNIGEIFAANGVVGTPFEQRARFAHALNQELSRNLSELDKVVRARVSVNIPVAGRYERETPLASASVTLHFEEGFDTQANLPKIRQIVSHSAPNMPYENVAVSFFKSPLLTIGKGIDESEALKSAVNTSSMTALQPNSWISKNWVSVVVVILLATILILIARLFLYAQRQPKELRQAVDQAINPTGRQQ